MLVRLKKRGEFVRHRNSVTRSPEGFYEQFRGVVIEVVPREPRSEWTCSGKIFEVTDTRVLRLLPQDTNGCRWCICEHYLIDDLSAFETDEIEVGDYMNVSAHK